jgi:nucleoside-diphosphate-sugar epimerase
MGLTQDVVASDLDSLCEVLAADFSRRAGRSLLITGGAGFLGYYLVQSVLGFNQGMDSRQRIDLTVWDNFARGVPPWLAGLAATPSFTLSDHNVAGPLPAGMGHFDYIVHAAGIASPTYYRQHPLETIDANVQGLRVLLDYCRRQASCGRGVEGFLFFSSSEIYGDPPPDQIPTREDYRGNVSCTGPRACYDESKRFGETLCVTFASQYGVPVKIVRPFNNYGPGLKLGDRRVVPDFARDVLAGRPVTLLCDGSPRRTFCYVADAVAGYYQALVRGRAGEAYNIGVAGPEVSMLELAEAMARVAGELFGYQGQVVQRTSPEAAYLVDNPQRRCPDIGKARRELDYSPRVGLEEGLRRTLLWYRQQPLAEEAA